MKNNLIFWVGYSDLMTSLFFIMLVLFALTVGYLQIKTRAAEDTSQGLQQMLDSVTIERDRYQMLANIEDKLEYLKFEEFHYIDECQKFIVRDLMGIEIFEPNQITIKSEYTERTIESGRKLEQFLKRLSEENKELNYLLIIEGNMANTWDQRHNQDASWAYRRSYERALAVYNLWIRRGINFRKYNVEVLLCGSGFSGLCRDPIEENNKRFSIQIIPKVNK